MVYQCQTFWLAGTSTAVVSLNGSSTTSVRSKLPTYLFPCCGDDVKTNTEAVQCASVLFICNSVMIWIWVPQLQCQVPVVDSPLLRLNDGFVPHSTEVHQSLVPCKSNMIWFFVLPPQRSVTSVVSQLSLSCHDSVSVPDFLTGWYNYSSYITPQKLNYLQFALNCQPIYFIVAAMMWRRQILK